MPLIYCVEDDDGIRELVSYALRSQGYQAKGFEKSEPFWKSLEKDVPDLILLDIMLPGEDGLAILKRLKDSPLWNSIPVVFMTARTGEYDIVKGLDMGADDYVKKPFGILELISRIRSVLRRSQKGKEKVKEESFGAVKIDRDAHRVTVDGKEIQLTLKEFDLLCYLLLNKGIVLSRNQIMQAVWDSPFGIESRTVDMHIMSLRQKLGKDGAAIHTVRGVGYRLLDKD